MARTLLSFILQSWFDTISICATAIFYQKNGLLNLAAVRIVDDVLIASETHTAQKFVRDVESKCKLGTVVFAPTDFLFFGLDLIQDSDMTTTIHGDSRLNALSCFLLDLHRRKQSEMTLNDVQLRSFRSINSSLGWLGSNASLFCTFYSSWVQQKAPSPTVKDLVSQINSLRPFKKLGTTSLYKRPSNGSFELSILIFADTSRKDDYGQLCFLSGLLFGDLKLDSIFHVLSWSPRKSRRPVKSVASAETLAAREAIDEGKVLVNALTELLNIKIGLWIAVDSKDLFSSLSTCWLALDRSIRGVVGSIRFEFATKTISKMISLLGTINLADSGTKTDSNLCQSFRLLFNTGSIPFIFEQAIFQSSDQFTG